MSDIKTNAVRMLDKAKIDYKLHTYTTEDEIDGISVAHTLGQDEKYVYKTLVTKGRSNYFVFVIPVGKELDLKAAARAVNEKSVSMIPVKDINAVTGYIRGGCSPVGMKKQFVTVIDESAKELDKIFVSGGKIGLQIELNPITLSDFIKSEFSMIAV